MINGKNDEHCFLPLIMLSKILCTS